MMSKLKDETDETGSTALKTCLANETRAFELEFIQTYQQLPILWDVTHPDYSNKYRRSIGNDTLLKVIKKWDNSATRVNVRQKINILRSCYRKDLRKYLKSKTIGPNGEEIYEYVPKNWKFYALRFLEGKADHDNDYQEENSMAQVDLDASNFDDGGTDESGNEAQSSPSGDILETFTVNEVYEEIPIPTINKNSLKRKLISQTDDYNDHDSIFDRELQAISSNVVCKLKRMNADQRCYAELLINKVLIGGLRNSLTEDTDLTEVFRG